MLPIGIPIDISMWAYSHQKSTKNHQRDSVSCRINCRLTTYSKIIPALSNNSHWSKVIIYKTVLSSRANKVKQNSTKNDRNPIPCPSASFPSRNFRLWGQYCRGNVASQVGPSSRSAAPLRMRCGSTVGRKGISH